MPRFENWGGGLHKPEQGNTIYVALHINCGGLFSYFSTDDEPTLPELHSFDSNTRECVNIIDKGGAKYQMFGILLLDDKTGAHVRSLIKKHSEDCESINLEIVQEWLQGRGANPVSWRTLTRMLKAVKLIVLAQDITDTLSEAYSLSCALSLSH